MKQALILPAWYQKMDRCWYPWLKKELEKRAYQVYLPDLPTMQSDTPNMQKQLDFIKTIIEIDTNTIVFGHSLGCLIAMRIAQTMKYKKMFLVAGWDYDDLQTAQASYWPNKINHELIRENVPEIYVLSSDNDPYYTANAAKEMAERFKAKYILIKGASHFTDEFGVTKIPELLTYI